MRLLVLATLVLTTSCSSAKNIKDNDYDSLYSEKSYNNDPLEPVNRVVFKFNDMADRVILEPVARGYRYALPKTIRKSIGSFIYNIGEPIRLVNTILQGDEKGAALVFMRFTINTTLGIGGIFDVAQARGIQRINADLGQTLGKYGVGSGYYIVLPLLGSSNIRDGSALFTTSFLNPLQYNGLEAGGKREIIKDDFKYGLTATEIIDQRAELIPVIDSARENSFDLYSVAREVYMKRREKLINDKSDRQIIK